MNFKKAILPLVVSCAAFAALPVYALDVSAKNNTNEVVSVGASQVHACAIVIQPKQTFNFPEAGIRRVCQGHEHDCIGTVYLSSDCSGSALADVVVDVEKGVVDVRNKNVNGYFVKGSGDNFTVMPPAAAKRFWLF